MRKLLVLILTQVTMHSYGQDGQFSQYFTTNTLINPAFVGINPEIEFSSNYKRGGNKEGDNYFELMQATFIYPLKVTTSQEHQVGGIGTTFFRESRGFQGIFTSQKVLLSGAYTLKLSTFANNYLAFGLQGGLVQNKISNEALMWGSQFNKFFGFDDALPGEAINFDPVTYPTFNVGVLYTVYDNEKLFVRDRSFIVGLTAENLNRPQTGQDENGGIHKNMLYKGFGSIKLELNPRLYFHPSTLILLQANNYQFNVGFYLTTMLNSARSNTLVLVQLGSWYRQGDSFIILSGLQIQQLKLGVSFDLNSSTFSNNEVFIQSNPSFEVSLTYTLSRQNKIRKVSNPIF